MEWTLEDLFAAADVGTVNDDAAIETAGAEQGGVEHVGAVGGGDEDDAVVGLKAVHLNEKLVEGLLALIVSAAETGATVTSDGIDLVDEDDARSVLLTLFEEVADARGADADEHFYKVRAGDREERHVGLTGDGAGEQGLAGSRRSDEQNALGDSAAERWNFCASRRNSMISLSSSLASSTPATSLKVIFFCCMESRRARDLAEAHRLVAAGLHLAHEEHKKAKHQGDWRKLDKNTEPRVSVLILDADIDVMLAQRLVQVRIIGRNGGVEEGLVSVVAGDLLTIDGDLIDLALIGIIEELAQDDGFIRPCVVAFDELPEAHEAGNHEDPNQNLFNGRVQLHLPCLRSDGSVFAATGVADVPQTGLVLRCAPYILTLDDAVHALEPCGGAKGTLAFGRNRASSNYLDSTPRSSIHTMIRCTIFGGNLILHLEATRFGACLADWQSTFRANTPLMRADALLWLAIELQFAGGALGTEAVRQV